MKLSGIRGGEINAEGSLILTRNSPFFTIDDCERLTVSSFHVRGCGSSFLGKLAASLAAIKYIWLR